LELEIKVGRGGVSGQRDGIAWTAGISDANKGKEVDSGLSGHIIMYNTWY
jgi:hypothetical protein